MVNYNRYFLTIFTLDVKSIVSLHWSRLHKDSKRKVYIRVHFIANRNIGRALADKLTRRMLE